jgi:hypothetical protein
VQIISKRISMIKFILGFAAACTIWLYILSTVDIPIYKVYDCGMAEWHPDVPADVKEECRKKKREEWIHRNERQIKTRISTDSVYLFKT